MWLRTICVRDRIQCWLSEFHLTWWNQGRTYFFIFSFQEMGNRHQNLKMSTKTWLHMLNNRLSVTWVLARITPKVCVCMCTGTYMLSKQENIEISRIRLFGKKLWYGKTQNESFTVYSTTCRHIFLNTLHNSYFQFLSKNGDIHLL